jgi:hypothetical protein
MAHALGRLSTTVLLEASRQLIAPRRVTWVGFVLDISESNLITLVRNVASDLGRLCLFLGNQRKETWEVDFHRFVLTIDVRRLT